MEVYFLSNRNSFFHAEKLYNIYTIDVVAYIFMHFKEGNKKNLTIIEQSTLGASCPELSDSQLQIWDNLLVLFLIFNFARYIL